MEGVRGGHIALEEIWQKVCTRPLKRRGIGEHQYVKEVDQDRKMCGFIQNVRRGQKW
jgi:hypothetical protein